MVNVLFHPFFRRKFSKIRDKNLKNRIIKQFDKIARNPDIGKPMKFARKGTREVHAGSYRLSYTYLEDKIVYLDPYHKDEQ
ncbi:type II toxin-antitoxin system RelE/ParE family toxin [Candidatus Woesearchaeota archaeon]|nr:type II toxin-antitoxin system RelE/ParE family toxin [Candidatus Woesearchaeota archaeon]